MDQKIEFAMKAVSAEDFTELCRDYQAKTENRGSNSPRSRRGFEGKPQPPGEGWLIFHNFLFSASLRFLAWLFVQCTIRCSCARSHSGHQVYTIVESYRRRSIDPLAYLHDALTRLPRSTNHTVHDLTPENWPKARAASQKQYAAAA